MRKTQNGVTAYIQNGAILWFEVGDEKIDPNHEDFGYYKSIYNHNPKTPHPIRPGIEL